MATIHVTLIVDLLMQTVVPARALANGPSTGCGCASRSMALPRATPLEVTL